MKEERNDFIDEIAPNTNDNNNNNNNSHSYSQNRLSGLLLLLLFRCCVAERNNTTQFVLHIFRNEIFTATMTAAIYLL